MAINTPVNVTDTLLDTEVARRIILRDIERLSEEINSITQHILALQHRRSRREQEIDELRKALGK